MTVTQDAAARQEPVVDTVDAVIVGAGFAGMYMLHKLRRLGFSAVVFEAAAGVGGTWYWNRYPGARCDVESINYSYSFDPDLEQEWDWTRALRDAARDPALRQPRRRSLRPAARHQVLDPGDGGRPSTSSRSAGRVTTDQGDDVSAQHLVMAVGCLSTSKMPEIPGIDAFRGNWYHTGHWPHEGVDFTGQRVGVIGTGSSAIQSIPIIAQQAADLTVFQRTPNFSLPAKNAPLDPDEFEALKARYPEHRQEARSPASACPTRSRRSRRSRSSDGGARGDLRATGSRRAAWSGCCSPYNDLITDKAANDTAAEYVRQRIRGIVDDPESPRRWRRRTTRSAPSGRASTPTTTPPTTCPTCTRRPPQDAAGRGDGDGDADVGARVRVRQHRVRHRLRRHDRVAAGVRHQGPRRRAAQGEVGGRAAHLPRRGDGRVPEPVDDHRPRQPVGARAT